MRSAEHKEGRRITLALSRPGRGEKLTAESAEERQGGGGSPEGAACSNARRATRRRQDRGLSWDLDGFGTDFALSFDVWWLKAM